jgi:hypothetical protein
MASKFPKTPLGRVSFAHVFVPTSMEEGGDKTYNMVLIFSPEAQRTAEFAAMVAAAKKCAVDKWREQAGTMQLKNPFRKCEEKPTLAGYLPGHVFVKFSTKRKPGLRGPLMEELVDENGFYSGCHAIATYTVYPFDKKGNRGVAFGLVNAQKHRDDEPFAGGSSNPDDDFETVEGGTPAPGAPATPSAADIW